MTPPVAGPPVPADDHAWPPRSPPRRASCWSRCAPGPWPTSAPGRPSTARRSGGAGDAAAHELLMARLAAARPDDAVLSEEGVADPARLTADRVWIVDPLDGTREYGEVPRDDWAVHVALVVGGDPVAGAVALPARGPDAGVLARARRCRPAAQGPPRVLVSRSRPPAEATRVADDAGRRAGADGLGGGQGDGGGARRRRGLPPQRRAVRVGLGGAGGGRPGRGPAHVAARRLAPRLQQRRPLPARPADLPARAGRRRDRSAARG